MPSRPEFCCVTTLIILSSLCLASSTCTHSLAFCEKWFIFFFRHIATEAECLALAKEGWGFVQLSVRKASLFDWQCASGFAYFCLERQKRERERERGGKGREMISPRRRWKRGKTLLPDDCCRDTPSLGVLFCPEPLSNAIHLWLEYFVGRPKLSAISSIISCRPTVDSSSLWRSFDRPPKNSDLDFRFSLLCATLSLVLKSEFERTESDF